VVVAMITKSVDTIDGRTRVLLPRYTSQGSVCELGVSEV